MWVAQAHMGPDRRFLPSETRVSLLSFHRPSIEEAEEAGMQTTMPGIAIDWVVSRSSYRQGGWLNVQSGHRNVHGMCRAVLRGEGNTEKVGMVTCCPEPRRRRITVIDEDRATFRAGCQNGKGRRCEPMLVPAGGSARQEKRARTSGDSDNPGKGCRPRGAPS